MLLSSLQTWTVNDSNLKYIKQRCRVWNHFCTRKIRYTLG